MDDVRREALPRQIPRGPGVGPSPRDDTLGTRLLGVESRQSALDGIVVDTRERQVVPYECVACPAIRETRRAGHGEATVVDEPCASERREGGVSLALGDPTHSEVSVDLRRASIAMAQGSERHLDGIPDCIRR